MSDLSEYLSDVVRPIVAEAADLGGWQIGIEDPYVGSIAFTRETPIGGIAHFYATPGWDGAEFIAIGVETVDAGGAVEKIECVDLRADWTRDAEIDAGLYRLAMARFVEAVNRGDWRDLYAVQSF